MPEARVLTGDAGAPWLLLFTQTTMGNMNEINFLTRKLALRRRHGLPPLDIRVRCEGRLHTIRRNEKGRLVLLDHGPEEVRRDLAFQEVGGTPCRCVQVWHTWNRHFREFGLKLDFPKPLKLEWDVIADIRACRRRLRVLHDELLHLP